MKKYTTSEKQEAWKNETNVDKTAQLIRATLRNVQANFPPKQ